MLLRQLFEEKAKRIVAVMPGGFHPFHPGHKSLYDWAVKTFGQGNVYVAATNDTAARPFPFDVKKKLAGMAGVPESNFIQVKSPFNAMSYKDIVDADTALVFVRSQKDKTEQPLPDQTKKNGEPGYLRTYTGKDLNSSDEMGYMAYGPTINFDFSGMQIKSASELRATWPEMSDEDKLKAAKLMYGNGAKAAVQLLDKALGGSVDEGDVIPFKKSNPANPHLDKDALDTWNKERNQKMAQDMIRLAPEIVEYYKELKDQNKDTETAIDIIAYDFDIDQYDVKRILQADNVDEDLEEAPVGEAVPYTGKSPQYKGVRVPTDDTVDAKDITKKAKKVDMPDEPYELDFDNVDKEKLKKILPKIIDTLTIEKDKKVLLARFGLAPFKKEYTLGQIAKAMGVTLEVVRQREQRALRQLRHPSRSRDLRQFMPMEDVSPEDEKKFHNELDDLVHKYFGDSPDEEKMKKKYRKTVEKAPPGREKQVKALKKKFDDPSAPYAIAWAQHNKKKK